MSYQALSLNGSGYASIADASQAGLDMGLSDFIVEARIKTTNTAGTSYFVWKHEDGVGGYYIRIEATTGKIKGNIYDGTNAGVVSTASVTDGRWHYVVFVVDRSSATGLKLFLDGSEMAYDSQTNPTGIGSLDNASGFAFGSQSAISVLYPFIGQADELRVWNFGYGGLPADWATYISWRAAGRNVFKDISEYNSGAWNCYADADRTEKVTDPGIESWTGDTPDNWTESGESPGVRDLTKELTEIHGGAAAAKFLFTDSDGTTLALFQNLTLVANKYYRVSGWYHFPTRSEGILRIRMNNVTDGYWATAVVTTTPTAAYTYGEGIGKPTIISNGVFCHIYEERITGIGYFDDISVKRVGLVAGWKFEGDLTDETTNSNTLTAGGTGNTFPGYTLKKQKIISPYSVR